MMRVSNDFILREIVGEYILVPIGNAAAKFNGLITMNEIGTFIFKTLQTEQTEEQLLDLNAKLNKIKRPKEKK